MSESYQLMEVHAAEEERGKDRKADKTMRELSFYETAKRLVRVAQDPECRKGLEALLRTITNGSISIADMVPGAGDSASWVADGCKFIARRTGITILDLTPDVAEWKAYGSELGEFVTFGIFPSHIVESALQLKADIPRIKAAHARAKKIMDPNVIDAASTILNDNDVPVAE